MNQPYYQASPALEHFILDSAPPFEPVDNAPGTYKELCDTIRPLRLADPVPVFSGGCEHTIFSRPEVNHALRAWHDLYHYNECKNFSLAHEVDIANMHVADAEALAVEYDLTEHDITVLYFEIAAQRAYYELHGEYVVEQDRFIKACLDNGMAQTLASKEVF